MEGRSRVSEVIKMITQSAWTHSALFIGRLCDIEAPHFRALIHRSYRGDPKERLLIEAQLGEGTIVVPVCKYRQYHLRICRPTGLAPDDAEAVIAYTIPRLGTAYDVRQLLDLARFFFPWGILPRHWRSSLFQHNAGGPTRTVCSCLLANLHHPVPFLVILLFTGVFLLIGPSLFLLAPGVLLAGLLLLFGSGRLRRRFISSRLLKQFRRVIPPMSSTEKEALNTGTVWWDAELFSGRPDWDKLLSLPGSRLSGREQAFLDGPVGCPW